jgi:hypothetical protein
MHPFMGSLNNSGVQAVTKATDTDSNCLGIKVRLSLFRARPHRSRVPFSLADGRRPRTCASYTPTSIK